MNVKRIKATSEDWGTDWSCTFEFDLDTQGAKGETIEDFLRETLLFFMGGKQKISEAGGDLFIAFSNMMGYHVMRKSEDWNIDGVIRHLKDEEGFIPLDGSFGVKLVDMDSFEISEEFESEVIDQ